MVSSVKNNICGTSDTTPMVSFGKCSQFSQQLRKGILNDLVMITESSHG